LLIAPGKSLIKQKEKIDTFIKEKNPFIISLNFIPQEIKANIAFITNIKRYNDLKNENQIQLYTTSNIENVQKEDKVLNYSTYLNNSEQYDNVTLMLLKVLIKLDIKKVNIAGFDGYNLETLDNYADEDLINLTKIKNFKNTNEAIKEELKELKKEISINFITTSLYEE